MIEALQMDTGLYATERKALCVTFLSVSIHSGSSRPRQLHLFDEVSVLCVCVKGAWCNYCKTALHFVSLHEAVTALSNLDLQQVEGSSS